MVGDQPTPPPSPPSSSSSLHRCRVCFKSFPCGRSLGGHMRSHVGTVAAAGDERAQSSYGLRENPKKTWRVSDSECGDGKKCCAECGKEFLTWRALFGHMKCHPVRSQPHRHDPGQKEELKKQSDHKITLAVPHRKKRTMRLPVTASCSLSGSDDERGEDGAISLMMLSRGSRYWSTAGGSGNSESSVKNSPVLKDTKGSELDDMRNEFKKTESDASNDLDGFGDCVEKLGKSCAKDNDLNYRASAEMGIKSPPVKVDLEVIESSEADESKLLADHVAEFHCDGPNPNAGEKRSRFECAACKKIFKSYQALGGHRANHKRMKCCPGSSTNTNSSTDRIATDQSAADRSDVSESSFVLAKKNKEHECLICGKVFSSGQALGGHKRCHLVKRFDGEGNAASDTMLQQQPLKLANLLDLNLPATAGGGGDFDSINDEENSESESWWIGGIVKHEGVQIGVISN